MAVWPTSTPTVPFDYGLSSGLVWIYLKLFYIVFNYLYFILVHFYLWYFFILFIYIYIICIILGYLNLLYFTHIILYFMTICRLQTAQSPTDWWSYPILYLLFNFLISLGIICTGMYRGLKNIQIYFYLIIYFSFISYYTYIYFISFYFMTNQNYNTAVTKA